MTPALQRLRDGAPGKIGTGHEHREKKETREAAYTQAPHHQQKRAGAKYRTGPSSCRRRPYAGAVALPGFTSGPGLPLPPDDDASGATLFGERGARPAMMSLI
jgi:hypothetical protein